MLSPFFLLLWLNLPFPPIFCSLAIFLPVQSCLRASLILFMAQSSTHRAQSQGSNSTLEGNNCLLHAHSDVCLHTIYWCHQCSVHSNHCLWKGGIRKVARRAVWELNYMYAVKYSPPLRYSFSAWSDKNVLNNWCGFLAELKCFYIVRLWPHKVFLKFLQCLYEYLTFSNGTLFHNFSTWLSSCWFI